MSEEIVIDERFRGPPDSANGGYTCALLAQQIDGPAEVTLRAPPPLGRALDLGVGEGGSIALLDGETLVAEAIPASVDIEVPDPVSLKEAEEAASRYPWRDRHPYPSCFVCGPDREAGDGLGIHPGPVDGRDDLYAAPWTPAREFAGQNGDVSAEVIWGALDCPSGIVTDLFGEVGRILLGRLAADIRRAVSAGSPHIVQAWTIGRDGRKLSTASALYTGGGDLCAVGRAVWIEVSPAS